MSVDTRYRGLRTRSRYSRRATIAALGRSGSRRAIRRRRRRSDDVATSGASVRRHRGPPDVLDEQGLERRFDELEVRDRRAACARAAARTAAGSAPSVELELGPVHADRPDRGRRAAGQPGRSPDPRRPRGARSAGRSTASGRGPSHRRRRRPRSTIATDSHIASAGSIWWVEKTSVRPRSRSSMNASRRSARLTGSSPVNGSSISRTSGSWRIAAMNWTFCWLPFESSSARRFAYSAMRKRVSQASASRGARSRVIAVQRPVVDELVEDRHPRVQPALLGQVAPRAARQLVGGPAVPADLAGVGRRMPRQIRMVVVLPAPLAPRKPKTSPRRDLKASPSKATVARSAS